MAIPTYDFEYAILANIRARRMLKYYSQEYMAYKIGINQQTYSKIESGQIRLHLDYLFMIAKTLEIAPTDLFPPHEPAEDKNPCNK